MGNSATGQTVARIAPRVTSTYACAVYTYFDTRFQIAALTTRNNCTYHRYTICKDEWLRLALSYPISTEVKTDTDIFDAIVKEACRTIELILEDNLCNLRFPASLLTACEAMHDHVIAFVGEPYDMLGAYVDDDGAHSYPCDELVATIGL